MHIQIFVPKKYKKVVRLDVTHYYSIIYVIIRKKKNFDDLMLFWRILIIFFS